MLVGVDHGLAFTRFDRDGADFVLEATGFHGGGGFLLRRQGEGVLFLAGQLPALGHVLGGDAHVIAVEGIGQAVLDHAVDHFGRAHLGPVAQVHDMRGLAHAFLAAGDDDVAVTQHDRLIAQGHGAQTGAAQLVDAIGRAFDRDAGVDGGLTGRVLTGAGLQDLAHDHFVDVLGGNPGALHGGADRDFTQVMSGNGAQASVERTDRGPRGAGDNDFSHASISPQKNTPARPGVDPRGEVAVTRICGTASL